MGTLQRAQERRRRHAHHRAGRRLLRLGHQGQPLPRRPGRTVRQPVGPRPARTGPRCRQPGGDTRVLPDLDLRPPHGHRTVGQVGLAGPWRPESRFLHHRWFRGGRVGLEVGPPVLQADRPARPRQGHQPQPRLPRHDHGRTLHHRTRVDQDHLRAAGARHRQGARDQPLPLPDLSGRASLLAPRRRCPRGGHSARGPRDRCSGVPRAGAERRRLLRAAARLLRPGARDLRPPRRAVGLRRGHLRLRAHRPHVRLRALRLPARHHHVGQGPHLRLRAPRRHDRE